MRRDDMVKAVERLKAGQCLSRRFQSALGRHDKVADEKIRAYETLIALGDDSEADAAMFDEIEKWLTLNGEEDIGQDLGPMNESAAEQVAGSGMAGSGVVVTAEDEDEYAAFRGCSTIVDVSDVVADWNDGMVLVRQVAQIIVAVGLGNPKWKRPRKQAWTQVYSELNQSVRFDYRGRGTASFRRVSGPKGTNVALQGMH